MKFLKLPQIIRVKQISVELKSIHPDAKLIADFDKEIILLTDSGEEMVSSEFVPGSRTRELMEEVEEIYA